MDRCFDRSKCALILYPKALVDGCLSIHLSQNEFHLKLKRYGTVNIYFLLPFLSECATFVFCYQKANKVAQYMIIKAFILRISHLAGKWKKLSRFLNIIRILIPWLDACQLCCLLHIYFSVTEIHSFPPYKIIVSINLWQYSEGLAHVQCSQKTSTE